MNLIALMTQKIITVHFNYAPDGVMQPQPVASRDKCRARQLKPKTNNKGEQQNENIKSKRILSTLHARS